MSEAVGALIELSIGELLFAEQNGQGIRCFACLRLDQLMHAPITGIRCLGVVPVFENFLLFIGREQG